MGSFEDLISHKKKLIENQQNEVDKYEALSKRFNLEVVDIPGIADQCLVSADVNGIVNKVNYDYMDIHYKEPCFARPYVIVDGIKIFSKPYSFTLVDIEFAIGETDAEPVVNWIPMMLSAGINHSVVDQVKQHIHHSSDFNLGDYDIQRKLRGEDPDQDQQDPADWWK